MKINTIEFINLAEFPNAARLKEKTKDVYGHCLGEQDLALLVAKLQQQLVLEGYITSRVVLIDDNKRDDMLALKLIPGRIEDISHHQDSTDNAQLSTLFPGKLGDLVNLRDLEQGLENLQRLPSVNATLDLELNRQDLTSQIIVNRQQSRFWRMNGYLDDAGNDTIGRYRAGLTLFLDNPLGLSDLFYVSVNRDVDRQPDKGSYSNMLHYSVPYGYWLFSLTGSQGSRYQSLFFESKFFEYRTRWKAVDIQIKRLLTRGMNYKTIGYIGPLIRQSNGFFGKKALGVQRLNTTDWQLGVEHQHYLPWATFNGTVRYQQEAPWFGAKPIPGKKSTSPARLVDITGSLAIPFKLGKQSFYYRPTFSQQYTFSDISKLDKFSIGGRSSVRGFSDSYALTGSRGWYLKNDISWASPLVGQQLYMGMDVGQVSEKGRPLLQGDHLAGAVTGVRGSYHSFGYDFNLGIPIAKPTGFHADPLVLGFTLSWQY